VSAYDRTHRITHKIWMLSLLAMVPPSVALDGQQPQRPLRGLDLKGSTHLGIGYVANIPTTFLGFSMLAVTPRVAGGAGVYADLKMTTDSPSDGRDYLPGVSVSDAEVTYGDIRFTEKSDWVSVNVGLIYAITREFAVYGGVGYSKEHHYRQYYDASQTRGEFGYYWIADPAASGTRINALGGAFIRLTSFALFQLGVEAQPLGADIGVVLTFKP
jgi:hypothetical protein